MGFLPNLASATVKIALTPIAIIKDAVDVVRGKDSETTKSLLNSAVEDFAKAGVSLSEGKLL